MATDPVRDPEPGPSDGDLTRVETPPEPERPAPSSETSRERARRHGRRYLLYGWAALAVALVGLIIAWVAANTETVAVDWLVGSTDAALALVIFVAAALGWLLGLVTAAVIRRRTRPRRPKG
jgi:uncharacterized integral membrane protein